MLAIFRDDIIICIWEENDTGKYRNVMGTKQQENRLWFWVGNEDWRRKIAKIVVEVKNGQKKSNGMRKAKTEGKTKRKWRNGLKFSV